MVRMLSSICEKEEKSSEVPQGQLEISQRVLYHWFIGLNIRTMDYADVHEDREKTVHARLQERGDDRRHPESVSAMTRETLICTVLCNGNSLFIVAI